MAVPSAPGEILVESSAAHGRREAVRPLIPAHRDYASASGRTINHGRGLPRRIVCNPSKPGTHLKVRRAVLEHRGQCSRSRTRFATIAAAAGRIPPAIGFLQRCLPARETQPLRFCRNRAEQGIQASPKCVNLLRGCPVVGLNARWRSMMVMMTVADLRRCGSRQHKGQQRRYTSENCRRAREHESPFVRCD